MVGINGGLQIGGQSISSSAVLTKSEREDFESVYPIIINKLIEVNNEIMPGIEGTADWIRELADYNVCGGKKLRGLMVPATYKCFVKDPSPEDMRKSYVLGWAIEVFQAASLIADDIMDESTTRRGKLCWYQREDVGATAIRDSLLLVKLAYRLVKIYFEDTPCFNALWDCMVDVIQKTVYGQSLDFKTSQSEDIRESFTMERYNAIVKYKTSYYTMYFPVALAMILAGKDEEKDTLKAVERMLLEIGHYFQVQDDYLDCFGNEEETGKVGTDIQDRKCSWLVVQALKLCSPSQLQLLIQNYGKRDPKCVEEVKKLYRDLNLPRVYADYEMEMQTTIIEKINQLPDTVDKDVFWEFFQKLFHRRK